MLNLNKLNRGAGVLMPISSLPSVYGIGTLGDESRHFADFLKRIGCRYWQVLPVGPTSYGDSPYQSFSAFAGNPYFIDLEYLVIEELLKPDEVKDMSEQGREDRIDYSTLYSLRFTILKKAYQRSKYRTTKEYTAFYESNKFWLDDYCLFMAVKEYFNNQEWVLWDEDIKLREPKAVIKYQKLLDEEIHFWEFCQFKFKEQWNQMKEYTNKLGIQIIGDIPLYVSADSADVWVYGDLFELDQRRNPINVAGVPPDAFSADGQRWGNPLYSWDAMEDTDYTWWRERMKISSNLYDVIRIDHFIGVVNYFSIPAEEQTAVKGTWRKGPGKKLTNVIKESIGGAKMIAEDLGVITPLVRKLIEQTGYPGMKVLQFSMDGPADHEYLPHNYKTTNLVAYTGTHDNETLVGCINSKKDQELEFAYHYYNVKNKIDLSDAMIRVLYSSIADVVIVQMQDLLKLDNQARMNTPSTIGKNWQWKMTKEQYKVINEEILREYATIYSRTNKI